MQAKKAEELRREWKGQNCDHPDFSKEYDFGADTGDLVCTTCGELFTRAEKKEIESKRINEK